MNLKLGECNLLSQVTKANAPRIPSIEKPNSKTMQHKTPHGLIAPAKGLVGLEE